MFYLFFLDVPILLLLNLYFLYSTAIISNHSSNYYIEACVIFLKLVFRGINLVFYSGTSACGSFKYIFSFNSFIFLFFIFFNQCYKELNSYMRISKKKEFFSPFPPFLFPITTVFSWFSCFIGYLRCITKIYPCTIGYVSFKYW